MRLRAVTCASGAATMAVQMAAVRLLAPWFGTSVLVWMTTIGLSLVAMAAGYAAGGRIADRRPAGSTLAATLAAAAILVGAVPVAAPSVLPQLPGAEVAGVGFAYGLLFLAPAVLLGMSLPLAVRLAVGTVDAAGAAVGGIYAISTVGSIVGTLLTAMVLLQAIGTRATLWCIATLLVVAATTVRTVRPLRGIPVRQPEGAVPRTARRIGPVLACAIVVVEGSATMGMEFAGQRLVAPFFGASQVVWAILIAVVMGCIALGSRLGGRLADRHPDPAALATLLAGSAAVIALIPVVVVPIMRPASGAIDEGAVAPLVTRFLVSMAVLGVPIVLLAMVPPWVARMSIVDAPRSGRTVGMLYAGSTVGALAGTIATALWLVPTVGPRRTLVILALLLVFAAVACLRARATSDLDVRTRVRALAICGAALGVLVLVALAPHGLVRPGREGGRVLAESESRYQFAQVSQRPGGRRVLQLNEGWAVHSVWDPRSVLTGGYWDRFLVAPSLLPRSAARPDGVARDRVLVIGSAGGSIARAFAAIRPATTVTGVELDPAVTALGRRWLGASGTVHHADGRPFLRRTTAHWDLIVLDAFRQPYIPFHLTTREAFESMRDRLQEGGMIAVNVGVTPGDPRMEHAIAATMRAVFPTVLELPVGEYNRIVVGLTERGVGLDELRQRIRVSPVVGRDINDATDQQRALLGVARTFEESLRPVDPDPDAVLTDDRAPVEWMTDRMIFGAAR